MSRYLLIILTIQAAAGLVSAGLFVVHLAGDRFGLSTENAGLLGWLFAGVALGALVLAVPGLRRAVTAQEEEAGATRRCSWSS